MWAEPADCEEGMLPVAEDLNIASSLYAPAEVAPLHLALPPTHTHHPFTDVSASRDFK